MNPQETHGRSGVTGAVMALSGGTPWQVVSPTVVEGSYLLAGVAVASPEEVWVAGHAQQHPLVALWDGARWTVPPGPPPSANHVGAGFRGIALAPERPVQAIAVGGAFDRVRGVEVPLIHHWDGSSWDAWNDAPLGQGCILTDVTLIGEEAWAVGHGFPWGGPPGPVALHWREGNWHAAEMPPIAKGKLLAVSGTADDDVWAVGAADRVGLVMHYDGRSWSRVPSPSTRFPLTDVAALSRSDVWAVGRDRVLHWDGRKWRKAKAPVTAANTVTAPAPDDVWVAGGRGELAHFDGHRWTSASSPQPLGDDAVWLASASLPSPETGGVWLAGSHQVSRTGGVGTAPSVTAHSSDP
ncbi:hypothetical protein GCM10010191_69190 [Actinomadura vinacea]|uniref:Exo-alpha-sialidase n=1 Tax=Actinomadura vinacea TaxID=115336 RepID=A0ABN3JY67_9ACTN